jgi:NADPH-dependent F420 reductase
VAKVRGHNFYVPQLWIRSMNPTIAIIGGTGAEGTGLALRFARAGATVRIGSRDANRARATAQSVKEIAQGGDVEGYANPEAVSGASVVVLTLPFEVQVGTLQSIAPGLRPGMVLVDATVQLNAASAEASALQAARLAPEGVAMAAAFHTLGAALLADLDHAIDSDVLICTDNPEARRVIFELVALLPGARAVDAGPLRNARLIENLVPLLIAVNRRHKIKHAGIRITGI